MLRTSRYRHKRGVCWEDSIQESTPETAPERQGNLVFYDFVSYGPRREKTSLREFADNKGADQPAHPRRLISTFVIRFLKTIISRLAMSEIAILLLVSVAEQAGLSLALSGISKTGFVAKGLILSWL